MRLLPALLALLSLATLSPAAEPTKAAPGKTVKLLTIGNSFSANATHYLGDLATASGNKLVHKPLVIGGAAFDIHWTKVEKFEADPKDKAGQYSDGLGLQQELQADKWDFITIQQSSIKSHDLATYEPYARQLRDYIKKYAPGAELVIHETWPYRVDDPRFSPKEPKAGEPKTQAEMYEGLRNSYRATAKELGLRLLPVGDAFNLANSDPAWGYQAPAGVKMSAFQYPDLPPQTHSLNKGYAWKADPAGKQTLGMDGHHANTAGEYLGACVWFEVMFGQSVIGNTYRPPGLSAEDAAYLQKTAHLAVEEEKARVK
ncbi:MAG TPA: DUF4886 domain-containing protein [Chthoniobacteraceae bacterium]|jgi:hypothetical protein|nr:DUF4886 domain-containing protein [Chthoniobacteraceae bacterium]